MHFYSFGCNIKGAGEAARRWEKGIGIGEWTIGSGVPESHFSGRSYPPPGTRVGIVGTPREAEERPGGAARRVSGNAALKIDKRPPRSRPVRSFSVYPREILAGHVAVHSPRPRKTERRASIPDVISTLRSTFASALRRPSPRANPDPPFPFAEDPVKFDRASDLLSCCFPSIVHDRSNQPGTKGTRGARRSAEDKKKKKGMAGG